MVKETKEDIEYRERVRALRCYIGTHFPKSRKDCGGKFEVHHQLGVVRHHRRVMCLCTNHHSAQTPLSFGESVHKGTRSFEAKYTTQAKMVEWTQKQLGEI